MSLGDRVAGLWNEHLLPRAVEVTCSERATGKWRHQVCAPVSGEVLEVGFGSGTNLAHYPAAVSTVLAVEPSDLAWRRAQDAVRDFDRPVVRVGLDGASLAMSDASVDAVVSSYTMCTIGDVASALSEFRRVLRPGGRLHFVEHSLSPDDPVAARQRRWQPRWEKVAGGCHLDRDIPGLVSAAGFTIADLEAFYAPGPAFARPFGWLTIGTATP
ncbi:MAG: SAM-dependent methyltransferase [Marmoricola sp.]|nr:SAM-dependent methyltransferase [Marmoricola sp.]